MLHHFLVGKVVYIETYICSVQIDQGSETRGPTEVFLRLRLSNEQTKLQVFDQEFVTHGQKCLNMSKLSVICDIFSKTVARKGFVAFNCGPQRLFSTDAARGL